MSRYWLVDMGEVRYAVGSAAELELRSAPTVSRPPLSPEEMAGFTVLDRRTLTLLDLAACIGLPPGVGPSQILFSGAPGEIGLHFRGFCRPLDPAAGEILPLPPFLQSPVAADCILVDGAVIPLLDFDRLLEAISGPDWEPPHPALVSPPSGGEGLSGACRLFCAGGILLAAPAGIFEGEAFSSAEITPVAATPPMVPGVTLHEGRPLTVIDLAAALHLPEGSRGAGVILPARLNGALWGFLVEEDRGVIPVADDALLLLPPLARRPAIAQALEHGGGLVPCLDLALLLLAGKEEVEGEGGEEEPAEGEKRGERTDRVMEFALLGSRYALPRDEVVDVQPLPGYWPLPGMSPLLLGLTRRDGALWPVIDLTVYFGCRQAITAQSQGIALTRGDFNAVIVAGEVFGERTIPRELQRELPFALPLPLVYGCYLQESAVLLVLNARSMALHFSSDLAKDVQGTFLGLGDEGPKEAAPSAAGPFFIEMPPPVAAPDESVVFDLKAECEEGEEAEVAEVGRVSAIAPVSTPDEETPPAAPLPTPENDPPVIVPPLTLPELPELAVQIPLPERPAAVPAPSADPPDSRAAEMPPPAAVPGADPVEPPETPVIATPSPFLPEISSVEVSADAELPTAQVKNAAPLMQEAETPPPEVEPSAPPPVSPPVRVVLNEPVANDAGAVCPPPSPLREEKPPSRGPAAGGRRFYLAAAAVVLLAAFALYWLFPFNGDLSRPGVSSPSARERLPSTALPVVVPDKAPYVAVEAPAAAVPLADGAATDVPAAGVPGIQTPIAEVPGGENSAEERAVVAAPLAEVPGVELAPPSFDPPVPGALPVVEPYEVRPGDNLWSISRRFMGDPWAFRQLARENRIPEPDLIFPGQVILLPAETKARGDAP